MPATSAPELLVLHAVRLKGMTDAPAVAARFDLDRDEVAEILLDQQAYGWVQKVGFADLSGWGLTDAGRARNEAMLAAELDRVGARAAFEAAHQEFVPLNARLLDAVTRWQLRPEPGDALAVNDHTDHRWDDRVLADLASVVRRVGPLCAPLAAALVRFEGYPERLSAAMRRVEAGERRWVDQITIDSLHTVWFELHEDLLATLNVSRGSPG